jgi:hypothetical protein
MDKVHAYGETEMKKANLLLITIQLAFPSFSCAMGKRPLIEAKAQLAEQLKLADKLTGMENNFNGRIAGIEKANLDLKAKMDAQGAAIAGFNNTVSKVSSEVKAQAGRDNSINDSKLMQDYIAALKDGHAALIDVMWKIIGLLIVQLVGIIGAFGGYMFFTIKSLLKARDKDDEREDDMRKNAIKKQEAGR